MMLVYTTKVAVQTSRRTDDLPDFTQFVEPAKIDASEIIQDGLALQAEIERYRTRASSSFAELDEFFTSLDE